MDFQNIWFQLSWIGLNLTLILVIRYSAGKFQTYLQTLSNFCQQNCKKISVRDQSFNLSSKLSEIVMWLHQIYGPIMQNSQWVVLYRFPKVAWWTTYVWDQIAKETKISWKSLCRWQKVTSKSKSSVLEGKFEIYQIYSIIKDSSVDLGVKSKIV